MFSNEERDLLSPAMIQKVVAAYFAATRAMDVEAWIKTFAEDATSYEPVGSLPIQGHAGLREFHQAIVSLVEKFGLTEDHVFIAGNGAAVKWTGRCLGQNGLEVTFEGIDVFEINDQGTIQKLWAYWDPTGLMTTLLN